MCVITENPKGALCSKLGMKGKLMNDTLYYYRIKRFVIYIDGVDLLMAIA
jgi:hypothetical protein